MITADIQFDTTVLLRLFGEIDRLPPGATGSLVFLAGDVPQGTVLIEDNRVCWAAASSMQNRLTDLLRFQTNPPPPGGAFDEVFDECRRDGRPLGETLLARGLVTAEGLWRGLRQHAAEAIARLSTAGDLTPVWAENRKRRYNARFAFATPELVVTIASFGNELEARKAERRLAEVTPPGSVGLAYLAGGAHDLPLAYVAADEWHARSLAAVGHWARNALASLEDPDKSVLVSESAQAVRRAWLSDGFIFVRFLSSVEERAPAEGSRPDSSVFL